MIFSHNQATALHQVIWAQLFVAAALQPLKLKVSYALDLDLIFLAIYIVAIRAAHVTAFIFIFISAFSGSCSYGMVLEKPLQNWQNTLTHIFTVRNFHLIGFNSFGQQQQLLQQWPSLTGPPSLHMISLSVGNKNSYIDSWRNVSMLQWVSWNLVRS